jgi:long-chain acyl-CoA synthetase
MANKLFARASLVHDFLRNSAAKHPDKTALVCDGARLTYGEINAMANRFANALVHLGIKRGDAVAIQLKNSVECVVGIFGTLIAGAMFVVINHTTRHEKLFYILNNCRAKIAAIDQQSEIAKRLLDSPEALTNLQTVILCGAEPINGRRASLHFDDIQGLFPDTDLQRRNIDLDLACLIYTSGSTGEPKGVMCDHSNVVFAAQAIIDYLENVPDDIVINLLPLSFDYGLYQLLMTFAFGGTLVLEKSFAFPAAILKRIEAERVTGFPGVPTIYSMLLQMDLAQFDLSSLRYLTNTAAALPESHIRRLRDGFPNVTLYSMYGLTETKRTLYLPPEELDRRPGSVGIPIPGTDAWVEDEAGRRLRPGEVGELVVRGRHVMRGYWEAPEETAQRFRGGDVPGERLCYSGDLFRMDADGFFYFVGRKDDIIKSRGEKVAPKEVENVIHGLAGVAEVAVIGVPDDLLGQAIKALIVPSHADLTKNAVLVHCKEHLEDFMIPRQIEFVAALPKTTNGKIARRNLVQESRQLAAP